MKRKRETLEDPHLLTPSAMSGDFQHQLGETPPARKFRSVASPQESGPAVRSDPGSPSAATDVSPASRVVPLGVIPIATPSTATDVSPSSSTLPRDVTIKPTTTSTAPPPAPCQTSAAAPSSSISQLAPVTEKNVDLDLSEVGVSFDCLDGAISSLLRNFRYEFVSHRAESLVDTVCIAYSCLLRTIVELGNEYGDFSRLRGPLERSSRACEIVRVSIVDVTRESLSFQNVAQMRKQTLYSSVEISIEVNLKVRFSPTNLDTDREFHIVLMKEMVNHDPLLLSRKIRRHCKKWIQLLTSGVVAHSAGVSDVRKKKKPKLGEAEEEEGERNEKEDGEVEDTTSYRLKDGKLYFDQHFSIIDSKGDGREKVLRRMGVICCPSPGEARFRLMHEFDRAFANKIYLSARPQAETPVCDRDLLEFFAHRNRVLPQGVELNRRLLLECTLPVVKVRCSLGISVATHVGNGFFVTTGHSFRPDATITIVLLENTITPRLVVEKWINFQDDGADLAVFSVKPKEPGTGFEIQEQNLILRDEDREFKVPFFAVRSHLCVQEKIHLLCVTVRRVENVAHVQYYDCFYLRGHVTLWVKEDAIGYTGKFQRGHSGSPIYSLCRIVVQGIQRVVAMFIGIHVQEDGQLGAKQLSFQGLPTECMIRMFAKDSLGSLNARWNQETGFFEKISSGEQL